MTDRYENIRKALDDDRALLDEIRESIGGGPYDTITKRIRALRAERDALAAALEAAREDAERYRWLADNVESLPYPDMWRNKEWLDAAIDLARGKGGCGEGVANG